MKPNDRILDISEIEMMGGGGGGGKAEMGENEGFLHLSPLNFSQTTNIRLFKIARLCRRQNFKLDENGRKFFKQEKKHCGNRRNCSLRVISPFLTVFSKEQGLLEKGLTYRFQIEKI